MTLLREKAKAALDVERQLANDGDQWVDHKPLPFILSCHTALNHFSSPFCFSFNCQLLD